jgi:hypothetical protein
MLVGLFCPMSPTEAPRVINTGTAQVESGFGLTVRAYDGHSQAPVWRQPFVTVGRIGN